MDLKSSISDFEIDTRAKLFEKLAQEKVSNNYGTQYKITASKHFQMMMILSCRLVESTNKPLQYQSMNPVTYFIFSREITSYGSALGHHHLDDCMMLGIFIEGKANWSWCNRTLHLRLP